MSILMDIVNLWNEFLVTGIVTYIIALICLVGVLLLIKYKHTTSGAIVALIAGTFGQISKITITIGAFLACVRLVLTFI